MTPRFSLVVATLGRVAELGALLASLAAQVGPAFEVIVLDQNGDSRLDALLAHHGAAMPIRHLRSARRGVSHARNLGLPYCQGAIVGFPDDDCTYPPGVLAAVDAAFAADPALGLLSGAAAAPGGGLGYGLMLGKHRFGLAAVATLLLRPLGGLLLGLVRGRASELRYYTNHPSD